MIYQLLIILFQMSENPNFIVELFIRTLGIKHKLTFEKDKEEYFRVLFDTYLNGQGNPEELKQYIAAGIEDQRIIDILAEEVVEWQAKAADLKAAEQIKKQEKQVQKQKMESYVATKTKKAKEEAELEKKDKGEKAVQKTDKPEEHHGRKKHKGEKRQGAGQGKQREGKEGVVSEGKGLKYELSVQGKQKCKFFPFCKNMQTCQYYHPTEKCTYFPNCRFGESCLYEHEACKYKEKCTKPNCHYAHPFRKANPIEEMMKSFMTQHNPLSRTKKRFHQKPKEQQGEQQQQPPQEEPKKQ